MKPARTDKAKQLIDLPSEVDVVTIVEEKLTQIAIAQDTIATLQRELELLASFAKTTKREPAKKEPAPKTRKPSKKLFPLAQEVRVLFQKYDQVWLTTQEVATAINYTSRRGRLYNHLYYLASPRKQFLDRNGGRGARGMSFRLRQQQV